MKFWILFLLVSFTSMAFAQVPSQPSWADAILKLLTPGASVTTIAIIEGAMRLFPTAKPWSLLVPIRYAVASIAAILSWLAGVLDACISVTNNVKASAQPQAKK